LAVQLCEEWDINPVWLATGIGPQDLWPALPMPSLDQLREPQNAVFSSVFDRHLASLLLPDTNRYEVGSIPSNLEAATDYFKRLGLYYIQLQSELWISNLSSDSALEFAKELNKAGHEIFLRYPKEEWSVALKTAHQLSLSEQAREDRKKIPLRSGDVSVTIPNVKLKALDVLLARANRVAAESAKRLALIEFLKAPRESVSRWLSGKREPGGEIALRILQWVEEEERQQTNPGRALTRPGPKTQLRKSSYEKPKPGRTKS
jgi:hypothetical protein